MNNAKQLRLSLDLSIANLSDLSGVKVAEIERYEAAGEILQTTEHAILICLLENKYQKLNAMLQGSNTIKSEVFRKEFINTCNDSIQKCESELTQVKNQNYKLKFKLF